MLALFDTTQVADVEHREDLDEHVVGQGGYVRVQPPLTGLLRLLHHRLDVVHSSSSSLCVRDKLKNDKNE